MKIAQNAKAVKRPWGGYAVLKKNRFFWIKKLFVESKARLSLQSHQKRDEIWLVLEGVIKVQIGENHFQGIVGDIFYVPKKKKHRIIGVKQATVLELAIGQPSEGDIMRYEDDYGR